jgi:hypothetical protein
MSSDKSNPDISEDIQTEPPISEISETSESYSCPICQKAFTSQSSLKAHMIRSHRTRGLEYSREAPTPTVEPMESPIPDLLSDLKNIKSAVEFARWRDRLKMQAPDLYRVFFPTPKSEASEDVTSKLVNLEALRIMRQIREEMEASRPNQPNNNDSALIQSQLESYREELSKLREELHKKELEIYQKDLQHLNSAIEDLKRQVENARLATSDFAVLIKEVKDLGEKWIKFSGGPLVELLMNSLGYVKLPSEKLITKEAEKAEESLLELFEKRGWVCEG